MELVKFVVNDLHNNFPKYESSFWPKKKNVQKASQFLEKKIMAVLPPSMSLIIKQQERIVGVAYTFCCGAYVRFNTVNRFKLCQGCQPLLPAASPTMWCWTCAAGSFAENCGGKLHRWRGEFDIAYYLPIKKKWLSYFMHTITRGHLYQCELPAYGHQQT